MRTLFQKLFFGFWLTVAIVVLVLLATSYLVEPKETDFRARILPVIAQNSVAILQAGGPHALRSNLEMLQERRGVQAFLFDDQGRELSGRTPPSEVLAAIQKSSSGNVSTDDSQRYSVYRWAMDDGRTFVFAASFQWPRPPVGVGLEPPPLSGRVLGLLFRGPLALWFLAALLSAGLACYALARHIAVPVARLRAGARELGMGNLSVRVRPAMGKRRDELWDLAGDFDRMAEQIESLMERQRNLIRDISHELRSPLARLNLAVELARSGKGKELSRNLDMIERESYQLEELVEQMLTLSLLESEQGKGKTTEVHVAELLSKIISDVDFEAARRDVHVKLVGESEAAISGSHRYLRSAFENVIRNAAYYTAPGTEVHVSVREAAEGERERVVVSVQDHGPGVPEGQLKEIFEPFRRVGHSRDRRTGGVGLGLSIAKRIVDFYGGAIEAVNAPDGGLCVNLRLPNAIKGNQKRTKSPS